MAKHGNAGADRGGDKSRGAEDLIAVAGTRGAVMGQVEHEARRQIAQTLLRTGPLSAGGLARETELSKAHVSRHLRTLSRAGVVAPRAGARALGEEFTYALRIEGMPGWAFEGLLGRFLPLLCVAILDAIEIAGELSLTGVAEQLGLSKNDTVRYVLFIEALGWIGAATPARRRNPFRRYVRRAKNRWWLHLGLYRDDEMGRWDDEW